MPKLVYSFRFGSKEAFGRIVKLKGKLAPGMLADLIVLDADPFKANPADLHKCRGAITVFDGRLIHQADQS